MALLNGLRASLLLGVTVVGCATLPADRSERLAFCGGGPGSGLEVVADFELRHARDLTLSLPNVPLPADVPPDDPAHVFVMRAMLAQPVGPAPSGAARPPAGAPGRSVVCIVVPNQSSIIENADLAGFRP